MRAILFDLDDTLVVEESAAVAAFEATAGAAAGREVDVSVLALAARRCARAAWRAAATYPYCLRIGISSWEGLWCRFEGDGPEIAALRAWAPHYRRGAWSAALAEQGIHDEALAEELGERFGEERRRRHEPFPDAIDAITRLGQDHALGLVTNGASCLQREKLEASGLRSHFNAVVVSGDVGAGKPEAAIFEHALAELGVAPEHAVMVGDSIERDIEGALAAGMRAVWLNRHGTPGLTKVPEISSLSELSHVESEA